MYQNVSLIDQKNLRKKGISQWKRTLPSVGNNHLYMAGGEFPDGSASRSMWRYDPCFDSWQEMASMNAPRSELGMISIYL